MKHRIILATLLCAGISLGYAQDSYDDDIYYNPKKSQSQNTSNKKKSNYIANMADMDVDAYNRRGEQYYASPVDTIGAYVENGEDFIYTQQIQKYYNPTIVVDNADVLADVLSNAYGNVEIVIDDAGLPIFTPYYGYSWRYPYYGWASYPGWGLNIGPWGWSVGFYDPWYAWNWGPSWAWGPSWGWGPSWNWRPGWGGGYPGGRPPMADWRPHGNRPTGPRPGWSSNTRPGGNYASNHRPGTSTSRPGVSSRPGATDRPGLSNNRPSGLTPRPNNGHFGVVNNNGKWEYNTTGTSGHRQAGTGVVNSGNRNQNQNMTNRPNRTTNRISNPQNGVTHKNNVNTNTNTNRNYNTNRNTNTNRNYNTNRNTNTNRSYNSTRTTNTNRGGGSFGGGGSRRGGGGGGGRHR